MYERKLLFSLKEIKMNWAFLSFELLKNELKYSHANHNLKIVAKNNYKHSLRDWGKIISVLSIPLKNVFAIYFTYSLIL